MRSTEEVAATGSAQPPVCVICLGLGAIGAPIAEAFLGNEQFSVAAVIDPALAGQPFDGLTVAGSLADADVADAEVAVLATGSRVEAIAPQVEELVGRGLDVVSTAEELTFPWLAAGAEAAAIDRAARRTASTVVGTGVNPGFLMDFLPVALGGATIAPLRIHVTRRADLSKRRAKLSEKLGVGLDVDDWERQGGREKLGHVGLLESAYLCAAGLGAEPDKATFTREPVCAGTTVIGVHELAELVLPGGGSVTLELIFSVGNTDEDVIEVEGRDRLRLVAQDGVPGDSATIARVLHTARTVGAMPEGLRLPLEIPAWAPRLFEAQRDSKNGGAG
jgi:4-hydroxy-tetrahydrodipicolinate reductase